MGYEKQVGIQELLEASGLRFACVAKEMGLKKPTLSNKISGLRSFTSAEVEKLSEVLNVDLRIIRRAVPRIRE